MFGGFSVGWWLWYGKRFGVLIQMPWGRASTSPEAQIRFAGFVVHWFPNPDLVEVR
jgi:hypothetical protein